MASEASSLIQPEVGLTTYDSEAPFVKPAKQHGWVRRNWFWLMFALFGLVITFATVWACLTWVEFFENCRRPEFVSIDYINLPLDTQAINFRSTSGKLFLSESKEPGPMRVKIRKHAVDQHELNNLKVVNSTQNQKATIEFTDAVIWYQCIDVSYTLVIPSNWTTPLHITSEDLTVEVANLTKCAHFHSTLSDRPFTLNHVSCQGPVIVQLTEHPYTATTEEDSVIRLMNVSAEYLQVETPGHVEIQDASSDDTITVKTREGRMNLDRVVSRRHGFTLESQSGDITVSELRVGLAGNQTIDIKTRSGHIDMHNSTAAKIIISSKPSGTIRLSHLNDGLSGAPYRIVGAYTQEGKIEIDDSTQHSMYLETEQGKTTVQNLHMLMECPDATPLPLGMLSAQSTTGAISVSNTQQGNTTLQTTSGALTLSFPPTDFQGTFELRSSKGAQLTASGSQVSVSLNEPGKLLGCVGPVGSGHQSIVAKSVNGPVSLKVT
eukprot:gnl/Trimastix_PCT/4124.p1 GENE.gnl/Trimastix_PCT/4124~~gnl/Trimastix_PCT/4124.p1  ORF type:complete len:492 (+),score=72.13 gnl/Trimastix_PCT/4124:59-1534(+)